MTHRKYHDLLSVEMIQDNISAAAEFDDPFAEFERQFVDGAADPGTFSEDPDTLPNGLDRAFGRVAAFGRQKIVQTAHIPQRSFRPFQTWHAGASASSPASSFASQASASSAVT